MRILTVSDKVEPVLYGPHIQKRVGKVDLILACGDLPDYYLEYLVGLLDAPLHFVHGNHDKVVEVMKADRPALASNPFMWGVNLHCRAVGHAGLLLAGLEGCRAYNPDAPFQYSEADVARQIMRLAPQLLLNRLRHGRYLDILITHAPPRGIHDDEDLPHRGFAGYLWLLRRFRPRLMIHGHQHVYNRDAITESDYAGTRIINTYGYRVLELTEPRPGQGWQVVRGNRS